MGIHDGIKYTWLQVISCLALLNYMAQVDLMPYSIVAELLRLEEFLHPLNKLCLLTGG